MKIFQGSPEYFNLSGQLQGFTYLMLTLPYKCNYRCPKCFNLENNLPQIKEIPITLHDTLKKIEEAKHLGGKAVVIAGEGEPTLHADIKEIVKKINDLQMIPVVYSNASILTPEMAKFYQENNTSLVIALDSLSEERYSILTNTKHMLPQVLKNIAFIRELYSNNIEEKEGNRNVRIAINVTISTLNVDEVRTIKDFSGDDFYFVCNPLAMHGNAVNNWNKINPEHNNEANYSSLIKELSESGGPLTLDKSGICAYSLNGISIGPYGDYMTCAYTSKTNGLFDNIYTHSLAEAYSSKNLFETHFYKEHGKTPCLVRHKEFQNYIDGIKKEKAEVQFQSLVALV